MDESPSTRMRTHRLALRLDSGKIQVIGCKELLFEQVRLHAWGQVAIQAQHPAPLYNLCQQCNELCLRLYQGWISEGDEDGVESLL